MVSTHPNGGVGHNGLRPSPQSLHPIDRFRGIPNIHADTCTRRRSTVIVPNPRRRTFSARRGSDRCQRCQGAPARLLHLSASECLPGLLFVGFHSGYMHGAAAVSTIPRPNRPNGTVQSIEGRAGVGLRTWTLSTRAAAPSRREASKRSSRNLQRLTSAPPFLD